MRITLGTEEKQSDTLGNSTGNTISTPDFTRFLESSFNMLLLILFAGCLASCAAQTTSPPFAVQISSSPLRESTNSAAVPSVSSATSTGGPVVAILVSAVKSTHELNETTIAPVLELVKVLIQEFQVGVEFVMTVKKITKV